MAKIFIIFFSLLCHILNSVLPIFLCMTVVRIVGDIVVYGGPLLCVSQLRFSFSPNFFGILIFVLD